MRALVVAVGTRGDVQPALALALELRALGHAVRLCVPPNFLAWAKSFGLEAVSMGIEMRMPARQSGPMPQLTPEELRRLRESIPDLITEQFETIRAAVDSCDVIVGANAHQYAAPSIAEYAGIPCVTAVYAPVALPSIDLPPAPRPGHAADNVKDVSIEEQWRRASNDWNERALERINHNRARLSLRPIPDVLDYVFAKQICLAADSALAPAPITLGRKIFQSGTWVLEDSRPLPPELLNFLDGGDRPIFCGFGSMPVATEVTRVFIGAARAVGRRIIISRGWAELDFVDDASDCFVAGDVSHDLLFRRVAAVIHHGGAGTTAAAARAGIPQIITPMFSDQFYWSNRIVDLGIGTTTPHADMTEAALSQALRRVLDPAIADRARAFGREVTSDGAKKAAYWIEREAGVRKK